MVFFAQIIHFKGLHVTDIKEQLAVLLNTGKVKLLI